jgi:hypothetical protein
MDELQRWKHNLRGAYKTAGRWCGSGVPERYANADGEGRIEIITE